MRRIPYKRYLRDEDLEVPRRSAPNRDVRCTHLTDVLHSFNNVAESSTLNCSSCENEQHSDPTDENILNVPYACSNTQTGDGNSNEINCKMVQILLSVIYIRHSLSKVALKDVVNLVRLLRPDLNLSKSVDKVLVIDDENLALEYNFICPSCENPLHKSDSNDSVVRCMNCCKDFEKESLRKAESYFITIPIAPQLKTLIETENVSLVQHSKKVGCIQDIQDGLAYQAQWLLMKNPFSQFN